MGVLPIRPREATWQTPVQRFKKLIIMNIFDIIIYMRYICYYVGIFAKICISIFWFVMLYLMICETRLRFRCYLCELTYIDNATHN